MNLLGNSEVDQEDLDVSVVVPDILDSTTEEVVAVLIRTYSYDHTGLERPSSSCFDSVLVLECKF